MHEFQDFEFAHGDKKPSPEEELCWHVVYRALKDLNCYMYKSLRPIARDAYEWLLWTPKAARNIPFSFPWIASQLSLSELTISKIQDLARSFSNCHSQYDTKGTRQLELPFSCHVHPHRVENHGSQRALFHSSYSLPTYSSREE